MDWASSSQTLVLWWPFLLGSPGCHILDCIRSYAILARSYVRLHMIQDGGSGKARKSLGKAYESQEGHLVATL